MDKPIKHLNETDPAKVQLSADIFKRTFEIARLQAPKLCDEMNTQRSFILNIYDEHLGTIDSVIEKYSEHADLVWRCGYHHPTGGPVIALGFRCHAGINLNAMMRSKLGIEIPE